MKNLENTMINQFIRKAQSITCSFVGYSYGQDNNLMVKQWFDVGVNFNISCKNDNVHKNT